MVGCTWGDKMNDKTMAADTITVPGAALKAFVVDVLMVHGVPQDGAEIVAECLLMANLSGVDSHGVVRLAHYITRLTNGTIKANPSMQFEQRAPSLGIMDGGDGLGHIVTYHACTEAMKLAAESGSGVVVVKNSSHFGMTGYYINRLVEAGLYRDDDDGNRRLSHPIWLTKAFLWHESDCHWVSDGRYPGHPGYGNDVNSIRKNRSGKN